MLTKVKNNQCIHPGVQICSKIFVLFNENLDQYFSIILMTKKQTKPNTVIIVKWNFAWPAIHLDKKIYTVPHSQPLCGAGLVFTSSLCCLTSEVTDSPEMFVRLLSTHVEEPGIIALMASDLVQHCIWSYSAY